METNEQYLSMDKQLTEIQGFVDSQNEFLEKMKKRRIEIQKWLAESQNILAVANERLDKLSQKRETFIDEIKEILNTDPTEKPSVLE